MSAYVIAFVLGLFSHTADYDHHIWRVNDHVVGYAATEDSVVTTVDGWTLDLGFDR